MNKMMISTLVAFAFLSTGCCLRLGEDTRFGVNCCGKKDSENFVAEEKKEDEAVVTQPVVPVVDETKEVVAPQPISVKSYNNETMIGIGIAGALLLALGWKTYKQLTGKCHSDAGEKQV